MTIGRVPVAEARGATELVGFVNVEVARFTTVSENPSSTKPTSSPNKNAFYLPRALFSFHIFFALTRSRHRIARGSRLQTAGHVTAALFAPAGAELVIITLATIALRPGHARFAEAFALSIALQVYRTYNERRQLEMHPRQSQDILYSLTDRFRYSRTGSSVLGRLAGRNWDDTSRSWDRLDCWRTPNSGHRVRSPGTALCRSSIAPRTRYNCTLKEIVKFRAFRRNENWVEPRRQGYVRWQANGSSSEALLHGASL